MSSRAKASTLPHGAPTQLHCQCSAIVITGLLSSLARSGMSHTHPAMMQLRSVMGKPDARCSGAQPIGISWEGILNAIRGHLTNEMRKSMEEAWNQLGVEEAKVTPSFDEYWESFEVTDMPKKSTQWIVGSFQRLWRTCIGIDKISPKIMN